MSELNADGSADNKAYENQELGGGSINSEEVHHHAVSYNIPDKEPVYRKASVAVDTVDSRKKSVLSFYDPYTRRTLDHPTTTNETLFHLLKGSIGTGILAMPGAFKNSGLVVGFIATFIIGIIAFHCVHLLVQTSIELCRRKRVPALSYDEIAEAAFETGGPGWKKWSIFAKNFVKWFLFVYQIGGICVYALFIASNLQEVGAAYNGDFGVRIYMLIITIPLIVICWIPNLKYLAPFSMAATLVMIGGILIIFYYIFQDLPFDKRPAAAPIKLFPFYLGTVMFALEAIGVIMPLENNMKNPKAFKEWNGVLNTAMVIIVSFYVGMGFFGYLKYGEGAEGSITLNLPRDEIAAQVVKIALSAAIYISFALQFYVAIEILKPSITKRFPRYEELKWPDYLVRAGLVLLAVILAAAIPYLDLFISLLGAMCLSLLGFLFPAVFLMITFGKAEYGRYNWKLCKNIFIIIFALVGFFTGTILSIMDIVEAISTGA